MKPCRDATGLFERFQRAKEVRGRTPQLVELAVAAAGTIVGVGAPNLTRRLADQLVNGLTEACRGAAGGLPFDSTKSQWPGTPAHFAGSDQQAAPLIDRASAMVEEDGALNHADVARDIHDLAGLYLDFNRLDRAEALYRRALEIAEQAHRPGHVNVAHCLGSLARMLLMTNRLKEAEAICRHVLAIDEKSVGPDHPDVAAIASNLAVVLRTAGRLVEAEPLLRRAWRSTSDGSARTIPRWRLTSAT